MGIYFIISLSFFNKTLCMSVVLLSFFISIFYRRGEEFDLEKHPQVSIKWM